MAAAARQELVMAFSSLPSEVQVVLRKPCMNLLIVLETKPKARTILRSKLLNYYAGWLKGQYFLKCGMYAMADIIFVQQSETKHMV